MDGLPGWKWGFNDRGEVTSAARTEFAGAGAEPAAVAGQSWGYTYDGIGNRSSMTRSAAAVRQAGATLGPATSFTTSSLVKGIKGITDLKNGDWGFLRGWERYQSSGVGRPMHWGPADTSQGENFMKVGEGLYFGHDPAGGGNHSLEDMHQMNGANDPTRQNDTNYRCGGFDASATYFLDIVEIMKSVWQYIEDKQKNYQ